MHDRTPVRDWVTAGVPGSGWYCYRRLPGRNSRFYLPGRCRRLRVLAGIRRATDAAPLSLKFAKQINRTPGHVGGKPGVVRSGHVWLSARQPVARRIHGADTIGLETILSMSESPIPKLLGISPRFGTAYADMVA
jgi:hypothetical protein